MASRIHYTTIDAGDPLAVATFWQHVLGGRLDLDDDPDEGQEGYEVALDLADRSLLFIRVPEAKTVKNRMHFDVEPTDRTRDEEVERLLGLGATQADDRRRPDGAGWVVLRDPEGNEFCVVRSAAERPPST